MEPKPIKTKEPKVQIKPSVVEGEYLGNISDIHSKHVDDKQIHDIAAQILPKGKKPRLPKHKYKDMEGLGMKIPINNIARIGGAVLGGATIGAATLATEAALVGAGSAIEEGSLVGGFNAARDVMSARALATSSIGGGVGSGVNELLGGGPAANVIASIAGGIASRNAIKRYDKRQASQQERINETTSLLTNGQRLGGKRKGRSRLIPSQTEQNVDAPPTTGQQRQKQTLMDTVKDIATRKAKQATKQMQTIGKQISSGVQNIRQKLSGRNNDGMG